MMEQLNTYYIKALQDFPYGIDEVLENLQYAESLGTQLNKVYELYGRIYAEVLLDPITANIYYEWALQENPKTATLFPLYMNSLIGINAFDRAKKLADYALGVPGVDLGQIFLKLAYWAEKQRKWSISLGYLEKAKQHGYNENFHQFVCREVSRIQDKIPKQNARIGKKSKVRKLIA